VREGDEMLVTLGGKIADHREIKLIAIGEIDLQFLVAVFEHVKERRAPPVLRRIALRRRTVFEDVALVGIGIVSSESRGPRRSDARYR